MPPRLTIEFTTALVTISRRSGWPGSSAGVLLADLRREVVGQGALEVRVVRDRAREDVLLERELGVGHEHRELRRLQAQPVVRPLLELGVGRQELQPAVEVAAALEPVDEPLVHAHHRVLLRPGVAEQHVLLVVVAQHVLGDVVGHRGEHLVALLGGELALADDLAEQDLDVDLVVGGVDARRSCRWRRC